MLHRILVPLDGSTFAEAALPYALTFARREQGEVRLLTVREPVPVFAYGEWDVAAHDWADGYMAEVGERVEDLTGVMAAPGVREGPLVEEIVREAEGWGADLIVMSTHGRGALSRAWLGSVADGCVRHARRPVLLVRPEEDTPVDLGTAPHVARVVVALDGSELAETAIEPAVAVARLFDAPLSLLRAVAYPVGPMSPYMPHTIELNRDVVREAREASVEYLGGIAERLRARDLSVDTSVLTDRHPAHAILEHAGDDPIVMATHGRGGLGRVMLGSVADKVVRGAKGPVLVVPPKR